MRDLRPVWPDAPRLDEALVFPAYRFLPGHNERPGKTHCELRGLWGGVDLYHAGYLWEAHEAWEALWKSTSGATERGFYQGLIQMAAALIKVHVQQWRGAARLIERARHRLDGATGVGGIDVKDLLVQFDRCFHAGPEAVVWEDAPRVQPAST